MYKRIYKEANDSIPTNTELKEGLIKKAQTENKENKFKYLYRFGTMAAAIVIALGIINVLPKTQKHDIPEKSAEVTMEINQPMTSMSRTLPKTDLEDLKGTPPAFSPTDEFFYTDWVIPEGMEVIDQSDSSVEFSLGDMNITVTMASADIEGLMTEDKQGDYKKDYSGEIENIASNIYRVSLSRNGKTYLILTENVMPDDIENLLNSIK